jgi:hypothetical protein
MIDPCTFERFKYFLDRPKDGKKEIVNFICIQLNTMNELNGELLINLKEKKEYGLRHRLRVNIIESNENSIEIQDTANLNSYSKLFSFF